MKKSRLLAIVLAVMLCVLSFFAAGCARQKLDVPSDFDVDDELVLHWAPVDNARSYDVEIKSVSTGKKEEKNPRRANYSLSYLEEGDYEFRVKAVADGKKFSSSGWSETYSFHRDKETGCVYKLTANNTEYEVYKYGTAKGTLVIEDYYRGKPVTAIASGAFKGIHSEVTDLVVGNRVRTIGSLAFYSCATLKSVVLPESVTNIGASAFLRCSALESINIPDGVTVLPNEVFSYCTALKSINLNNITTIGEKAFDNCSSLTEAVIPDTVTSMAAAVFQSCKSLTSVKIGSGLSRLPSKSFYQCSMLENVEFSPESKISLIGSSAFAECSSLKTITLPSSVNRLDDYVFTASGALEEVNGVENLTAVGIGVLLGTKIYADSKFAVYLGDWLVGIRIELLNSLRSIDDNSFSIIATDEATGNETIVTEPIKSGVRGIANSTFARASNLLSVKLNPSIKHIGNIAFAYCPNLWRVTLPANGVTYLGDSAFRSCEVLIQFDFGNCLQRIGSYAFDGCTLFDNKKIDGKIDKTFIPDTVTEIGYHAFRDTKMTDPDNSEGSVFYAGNWAIGAVPQVVNLGADEEPTYVKPTSVTIEKGTRGIAGAAFWQNEKLTTVTGANEVEYIGNYAFYNCPKLANITLNTNVTEIGDFSFYCCYELYSVSLPRALERIGDYAFGMCANLTEVDFMRAQDLKSIGNYAFYGCANIQAVNLRNKVEYIGAAAFTNCSSIKSLTVPDGVKVINMATFANCSSLASIKLSEGLTAIDSLAFYGCTSLKSIHLPDSVKIVGDYAFYSNRALTDLDLGKVEHIGTRAFVGANQLGNVVIPSTVKYVGDMAFKKSGLHTVIIQQGAAGFGSHVFAINPALTIYTDASTADQTWNGDWNSSLASVLWNCELAEDGKTVKSITFSEENAENIYFIEGEGAPWWTPVLVKDGLMVIGWSTKENATLLDIEYPVNEMNKIPQGVKLYPVWVEFKLEELLPTE